MLECYVYMVMRFFILLHMQVELETDSWARTVTVALSVEVPVDVLLGIRDCSAGQEFKECLITTRAQKRDQLNDSLS